MTDLTYTVTIDGQPWSPEQLDRIQYERTLHGLHELKRLGVPVLHEGRELSDTDINWLEPAVAERVSLDTRAGLGEERVLEVFADVLADAERRWKEFNEGYVEGDVHTAEIEIEAHGIGFPETMAVLGGAASERDALAVMPEHYIVIGDLATGQRGMETFGMFGEPVYVHGVAGTEVPESMPFAKDPAFPVAVFGRMVLKSDDFPINVGALHQARPTADGFVVKSIFSCPKKAPKAIADGHKLHFAIEIVNSMKVAFAQEARDTVV